LRELLIVSIALLLCIACQSPAKSEAEQRGQKWFEESFTDCNGDYFAKYPSLVNEDDKFKRDQLLSLSELNVGEFGHSVREGIFQFKNLGLVVKDKSLTQTEKMNGNEVNAVGTLVYTQYRAYEGGKWNRWEDKPMVFSSPLKKMATDMLGVPPSPMYVVIDKSKGKWNVMLGHWKKLQCSELPPL
jgi:hypothetical protein